MIQLSQLQQLDKRTLILSVLFMLCLFVIATHAFYMHRESSDVSPLDIVAEVAWERPPGPPTVAVQVGHWKNDELPDELATLRGNTGAQAAGIAEWQVNKTIAEHVARILTTQGVVVEILPATVPPDYWSDVFVAIHADGSTDRNARGYKFAAPWRDSTKSAHELVTYLDASYAAATELPFDPNITRNMTSYYAFAWWRFEHSIHPMTTAAIAETGFLTNATDRKLIVAQAHRAAAGIAHGILLFLQSRNLIETTADLELLMSLS